MMNTKFKLLLLFFVSVLTVHAQDKRPTKVPVISFEKEIHDFGTIKEGDTVETAFVFTNTGNAPLIIKKISSSCGCTVPTWKKEPIMPGEKSQFQVKFNSKGKPNKTTKMVTVQCNTEKGRESVKIVAFATPNPDSAKRRKEAMLKRKELAEKRKQDKVANQLNALKKRNANKELKIATDPNASKEVLKRHKKILSLNKKISTIQTKIDQVKLLVNSLKKSNAALKKIQKKQALVKKLTDKIVVKDALVQDLIKKTLASKS